MESENKNDDSGTKSGFIEGRVVIHEDTNTISVEVPIEDGLSFAQLKIRQRVSQALAGMFRDGSHVILDFLKKAPHDADWARDMVAALEPYHYRVNDEALHAIQAELVASEGRDTEIGLRYLLGRIFSVRGEVNLGLDHIDRGLALVRPNETIQILALQHIKASLLCASGDTNGPAACRSAIQMARQLNNHHGAGNIFRIWSMFHWQRGEFDQAMPLFDEAAEHLRNVGSTPYAYHLLDTLERVAWLDRARARRYSNEILSVIADGRALDETQSARARLSVAQHLMATAPTRAERELALEQAVRALATFRKFAGFEGRAAACSSLLSIEYAYRGDFGLSHTYAVDHDLWLPVIFDNNEAFRAELGRCLSKGDVERLFGYEARVSTHANTTLYISWACVVAVVLLEKKEPSRVLELLSDAERRIGAKLADHNHEDLASIYRLRAEAHRTLNQDKQVLDALAEVVRFSSS